MKSRSPIIRTRFKEALEALQEQSACGAVMLEKKIKLKGQTTERQTLKAAQQRMKECEPETGLIWRFVMSGQAGKPIPDLTIDDLEPLIAAH